MLRYDSPVRFVKAALVVCIAVVGVWLSGLPGRALWGREAANLAATSAPDLPGQALVSVGELPHAWMTSTPTRPPSPTPSSTSTATRPSSTPAPPTPTPTPTTIPTPTITPTPIHKPSDGDPTRITIPAIDLDAKIVSVGIKEVVQGDRIQRVWEVADYAAGYHSGMARVGHAGNTVISAHNNIRGEVFRDLNQLKPGDEVFVWVGESSYRYKVSVKYRIPIKGAPPEVLQDNLKWILPTDDQRLTLVTCWPYWGNSHRIIVIAYPVPWSD